MAETADARIAKIAIDDGSLAPTSPEAEHERRVAIADLLDLNSFRLEGAPGPYEVRLSEVDGRLVLDVRSADGGPLRVLALSMSPFRRIIRDYFIVCESYNEAIRHATPTQIEAVDMGRRGLHNEGSELLTERLKGKAELDFDTARRLFTLMCALHRSR